jgi:O-antigen ligase
LEIEESITMSFKMKGSFLLFFLIVLSTSFLPSSLFSGFVVLLGLFLIISELKLNKFFFKSVAPLLIILLLGIIGISGHIRIHIIRDIIYALFPISLIFIGFRISKFGNKPEDIFKWILISGTIIACVHILKFLFHLDLLTKDINYIRSNAENPNISLVVLALCISIFIKPSGSLNSLWRKIQKYFFLPVLLISFILSFSRTGFIMGVFIGLSLKGLIGKINYKSILSLSVLILLFGLLMNLTPKDNLDSFFGKLARSISEIRISDYNNLEDINANWRGFETFKAIIAYSNGSTGEKIVGQGFGSLVDLGFTMTLDNVNFRDIPILHNGYAYILLKTGLLGLLSYLFFFIRNFRLAFKKIDSSLLSHRNASRILIGLILSMMLSMLVVGGIAEIHDSIFIMLLGYFVCEFSVEKDSGGSVQKELVAEDF